MKAVVQRVENASVYSDGKTLGSIEKGMLVLLGVRKGDGKEEVSKLADKIKKLRIFEDDRGKMNRSIEQESGQILIVSQFTLYGDCTQGNRPSFGQAADYKKAEKLYHDFLGKFEDEKGIKTESGTFGDYMKIEMTNDGPVTLILEY